MNATKGNSQELRQEYNQPIAGIQWPASGATACHTHDVNSKVTYNAFQERNVLPLLAVLSELEQCKAACESHFGKVKLHTHDWNVLNKAVCDDKASIFFIQTKIKALIKAEPVPQSS